MRKLFYIISIMIVIFSLSNCRIKILTEPWKVEGETIFPDESYNDTSSIENISSEQYLVDGSDSIPESLKIHDSNQKDISPQECKDKKGEFIFSYIQQQSKSTSGQISGLTMMNENLVFSLNEFKGGKIVNSSIVAVAFDGKIIFKKEMSFLNQGNYHFQFISTDDVLFSIKQDASEKYTISKHFTQNGEVVNQTSIVKYNKSNRPSIDKANDRIFVLAENTMYSYSISNFPELIWSYKHNSSLLCSPIVNGRSEIYTCSKDNHILLLNSNGKLIWRKKLQETVNASYNSSLSLGENNLIYKNNYHVIAYDIKTKKKLWEKGVLSKEEGSISSNNELWLNSNNNLIKITSKGEIQSAQLGEFYIINFTPTILSDNTGLVLNQYGLIHFSSDLEVINKHLPSRIYPSTDKIPNSNSVVVKDGKAFYIAKEISEKNVFIREGIFSVHCSFYSISSTGWPSRNGNFSNTRNKK